MMWIGGVIRYVLGFLDRIVYTLIELVYQLFMLISQAGIFSQATIQEFATRIYVFLGLIMVFKVSISLVTYILNPDNFSKGDVGAPALLKGFVFALLGIVLVPYVFEATYALQNIVLKDNLIGNLILGMDANQNAGDGDYLKNAGKDMAFTTLTAFVRIDSGMDGISERCASNPIATGKNPSDSSKLIYGLSEECEGLDKYLSEEGINSLISAYENRSIDDLLDYDLLTATYKNNGNKDYVINYLPIISTLAGAFIAYVLLLFCVDIAVRSVKLGFLQLIAPIPLIAKIDPKSGGKKFDNWVKKCITTYLDVFVRLAAIYFVLFIISTITVSGEAGIYNVVTGQGFSGISGLFVKVFIIIGALNFAREIPKLISDILGIDLKGSGGFTLNPAKKFGSTPLIGAAGGNLARRAIGGFDSMNTGGSFKDGWNDQKANDKGFIADAIKWKNKATPLTAKQNEAKKIAEERTDIKDKGAAIANEIEAVSAPGFTSAETAAITELKKSDKYKQAKQADRPAMEKQAAEKAKESVRKEKTPEVLFGNNANLAQSYRNMNFAKDKRNTTSSEYERAKMLHHKGQATEDQVLTAKLNADKASKEFEKQSDDFKKYLAADKASESRYNAYEIYNDLKQYSTNNSTTSTQQSASSVGGVAVSNPAPSGGATTKAGTSLEPGERITQSGIVLSGGVNIDNKK